MTAEILIFVCGHPTLVQCLEQWFGGWSSGEMECAWQFLKCWNLHINWSHTNPHTNSDFIKVDVMFNYEPSLLDISYWLTVQYRFQIDLQYSKDVTL